MITDVDDPDDAQTPAASLSSDVSRSADLNSSPSPALNFVFLPRIKYSGSCLLPGDVYYGLVTCPELF